MSDYDRGYRTARLDLAQYFTESAKKFEALEEPDVAALLEAAALHCIHAEIGES